MRFTKGSFEIAIKDGRGAVMKTVSGWVEPSGRFGIHHQSCGLYVLTHIPSGWAINGAWKKSRLTKLAAALGDLDWNIQESKRASIDGKKRWKWPDGTKEAAANIMNDLGFSTTAH